MAEPKQNTQEVEEGANTFGFFDSPENITINFKTTALVVDSSSTRSTELAKQLRNLGCEVIVSQSGNQAIALVQLSGLCFDVAFLSSCISDTTLQVVVDTIDSTSNGQTYICITTN